MINKERLNQAINVMERAGVVNMLTWQHSNYKDGICNKESELHQCGNTACFAGWLALSAEFIDSGGWVSPLSGAPAYGERIGSRAVADWLEANGFMAEVIELLITGSESVLDSTFEWLKSKGIQVDGDKLEPESEYTFVRIVGWEEFVAEDVIRILKVLHDQ